MYIILDSSQFSDIIHSNTIKIPVFFCESS